MNPRRTVTTTDAAWTFAGILGLLLAVLLLQHPEIFVWVIVIGGFIGCGAWIGVLHKQRDDAAVSEAEAIFKAAGAEHHAQQLAGDYDAVVRRLAEVLDEHALCPTPLHVVPAQRDGSEYEWPALARVLDIEGGDR